MNGKPKIESLENAMGIIEEWFDRPTHILPCESVCEAYKYICKKAVENEKKDSRKDK